MRCAKQEGGSGTFLREMRDTLGRVAGRYDGRKRRKRLDRDGTVLPVRVDSRSVQMDLFQSGKKKE